MSLPNLDVRITCSIIDKETKDFSYNTGITVLFCLAGTNTLWIGKEHILLNPAGMAAVNPFELYWVECEENGMMVELVIPRDFLRIGSYQYEKQNIFLRVSDHSSGTDGIYDCLRRKYADIFYNYYQENYISSKMVSDALAFLEILSKNFGTLTKEGNSHKQEEIISRLKLIVDYCHEHWKEDISLSTLAENIHLSPNYLSRFIKQYLHVTFREYLTGIRLQYAQYELINSNKTVMTIAYESGFGNDTSFISQFNAKYGMTPGEYRRNISVSMFETDIYVRNLQTVEKYQTLLQYMEKESIPENISQEYMENLYICIDGTEKGQYLYPVWKKILNMGRAIDGNTAQVREMMKKAQTEIGFEYVRIYGIFDEDMNFCYRNEEKHLVLSFIQLDMLLDYVCQLRLLPYIELGGVPELLFHEEDESAEDLIDEEEWGWVVNRTLVHLVERYGKKAVRNWRFSPVDGGVSGRKHLSFQQWMNLYRKTYDTLKNIDETFRIGGPGRVYQRIAENTFLERFLQEAMRINCIPDFISLSCAPDYIKKGKLEVVQETHFTRIFVKAVEKIIHRYYHKDIQIWLENWNCSLWETDPLSDTIHRAAFLAENLYDICKFTEGIGFGRLTDYTGRTVMIGNPFQGKDGMLTYQGIPKPGWYLLKMLNHFSGHIIAKGEGYLAVREEDTLCILLTRYCQYDNLYRNGAKKEYDKIYNLLHKRCAIRYNIELTEMRPGKYSIRECRINQEHGASFNSWVEMGSPSILCREELDYLDNISAPSYKRENVEIDGKYSFDIVLELLETVCIYIQWKDFLTSRKKG